MLKAAIIGAGFISEFHGEAYQKLENVTLCAVCDINKASAEALARKLHCRYDTDAERMLQEVRPDLVSICLPTFLHEEYTRMALRAGANVLCEKPMALTMESCERMAEEACRCHRLLMIAQVLRWWPEYQTITEQLRRMGLPDSISTKRLQYAKPDRWILDPNKGGGVLFDLFVHDLDFSCGLFGMEPKVRSVYGFRGESGSFRSLCAVLSWKNGTFAKIEASNRMPLGFPFTASFRADYPQSTILYSFRAPVNIQKDAKTQTEFLLFEKGEVRELLMAEGAQSQAFSREIEAFVKGVETNRSPLPIEQTLSVMKTVHQIKEILEQQGS